jgi:outer membrane protein assembly factor BamB
LPVYWNQTTNVRWKADLPGRGLSSPVVAAGRVYVTACSGYGQKRLHVLCFNAATGARLWERCFWATGSTTCAPKTCMAAPTPVTDGEAVYALFACGDLAALGADGRLRWYRALALDYPGLANQVGMAASPVLCGDVLVLSLENAGQSLALGVDRHTGRNRWAAERPRVIKWATPAVRAGAEGAEVLFQTWAELSAYDPATGQKRWTYTGEGPSTVTTPVSAGDLVVTQDGVALRPCAGRAPEVAWKSNKLKTTYASALAHDGRVYALHSTNFLTCADAATGRTLWQERVWGAYSASPVFADGKLYLVNEDGVTTVVAVGDPPRVLTGNPLGETLLATPAVAGGAIFLRSDPHLFCVGGQKP